MSRILRKILAIFIIVTSVAASWILMDIRIFTQNPLAIKGNGVTVTIPPGSSVSQFAAKLAAEGLLDHPRYLVWLARWNDQDQHIKAGEYYLKTGTTPPQLLEQIVTGKVVQYSITIVEGMTFRQLMDAVNSQEKLQHTLAQRSDQ
jgi:UPF0755 protein